MKGKIHFGRFIMAALLAMTAGNVWAGGSSVNEYKAHIEGKIGEGKVYGTSTANANPSTSDYKETLDLKWTKENKPNTIYLYALPTDGYVLKNWTTDDNSSVGIDCKTLSPISFNNEGTVNYVAHFVSADTPLGKYYRVKNVSTGKYISIVNNKKLDYYDLIGNVGGGLLKASGNIDKIYQALGEKYIGVDINMAQDDDLTGISDILFLRDAATSQYDVVGQGTSLNQLAQNEYAGHLYINFYNNFAKFTKRDAGNYLISLKPNCDNSMGNGLFTDCYFYDNDGKFAINQKKPDNETDNYHWQLEPVNYFCVKPLNENIKDGLGYYWTTLVTAFPYQIPAGGGVLGAYTVKQVTADNNNQNFAQLETLAQPGETVPAGTPVLLKMRSANASDNELIPVGNEFISTTNKVSGNMLSGVYLGDKEKNNTTKYRVLNVDPTTGKIGFFKLSSSVAYMGANKAFLELPATSGAKDEVYIDFDNIDSNTTGITTLHNADAVQGDNNIYDLQGRKVAQPQKGIYIVNGRKVVFK